MKRIACGLVIIMVIVPVRGPWCLANEAWSLSADLCLASFTIHFACALPSAFVKIQKPCLDLHASMANNIVSEPRHLACPSKFVCNTVCSHSDTQFVNILVSAQQAIDDHNEKEWRRIIRVRSGAEFEVTITPHFQCDFMFMLELGDAHTRGNFCRRCRRRIREIFKIARLGST